MGSLRFARLVFSLFFYAEFFPQGLWNVENLAVEKFRRNFASTGVVEKFRKIHIALWKKNPCAPNGNPGFPHKFLLPLLPLPKLTIDI